MDYGLQLLRLLPETILAVFGTAIMVADPFVRQKRKLGYLAVMGLLAALVGAVVQTGYLGPAFSNQIVNDWFAIFFRVLFILIGILVVPKTARMVSGTRRIGSTPMWLLWG